VQPAKTAERQTRKSKHDLRCRHTGGHGESGNSTGDSCFCKHRMKTKAVRHVASVNSKNMIKITSVVLTACRLAGSNLEL
jgi:hypothetical protein